MSKNNYQAATPAISPNTAEILVDRQRLENELIETQQALRESEELLRMTFEQAAVGIVIADFKGNLLHANSRCCKLLGYSLEELRKLNSKKITHPDDLDETSRQLKKLLSGESSEYSLEKRFLRKDGTQVWSHTTAAVLKDINGIPKSLIGVVEDISQRREAEELLRKSELFNRTIIESSRDCIKVLSTDGKVLWMSDSCLKEFCIADISQIIGNPWIDFWHKEDRPHVQAAVEAAANGSNGSFVGHYIINDRSMWWDIAVTPILNLAGEPEKLLAISRNITTRIQDEKDLQLKSHLLELLNRTGAAISSRLELQEMIQIVTDAATEISEAEFGAFFYKSKNISDEEFLLYALSGEQRETFESFGYSWATTLFKRTFKGEGIIRMADVLNDSRYSKISRNYSRSTTHIPLRSYLAVPVISRSGEVIGGLFFGHSKPNIFSERAQKTIEGIASQAAIAIDNARLYEAAQREIGVRKASDKALLEAQNELLINQIRLESIIIARN